MLAATSPFVPGLLADPAYPATPESMGIDVLGQVSFRDYTRLYMRAHGFRYLVLHRRPEAYPEVPVSVDRVAALLAGAEVYADDDVILFDRDRLPSPARPVAVCTRGWNERLVFDGRFGCLTSQVAEIVVENPKPGRPIHLGLEARGVIRPLAARLMLNGVELARWEFGPDAPRLMVTPPLPLPAGISRLTLECDGEEATRPRPRRPADPRPVGPARRRANGCPGGPAGRSARRAPGGCRGLIRADGRIERSAGRLACPVARRRPGTMLPFPLRGELTYHCGVPVATKNAVVAGPGSNRIPPIRPTPQRPPSLRRPRRP